MIILLPIFIRSSSFWKQKGNQQMIAEALQRIHNADSKKKCHVVVTDSSSIASLAKNKGWKYQLIKELTPESSNDPIDGMGAALHQLRRMAIQNDPIVIADFRNPFLDANMIDEAIRIHGDCNGCTLSVREPKDHPCQFNLYLRLVDTGILVNQNDTGTTNTSMPFAWKWDWYSEIKAGDSYSFNTTAQTLSPANKTDIPFLLATSPKTAQLHTENKTGLLSSMIPCDGPATIQLAKQEDSYTLSFCIDCDTDLIFRAIPFNQHGLDWDHAYEKVFSPPYLETNIQFPKKTAGIIYYLLSPVEDDTFDIIEPFMPPGAPWHIQPEQLNRRINTNSKRPILGRQEFPEIFEADGTLCIIPETDYKHEHWENTHPFILKSRSLIIKDQVDYLDYLIKNGDLP